MSRNKELIKNTAIIALGKICTQFITFFLLPIYTRYLSTDEYGTVDLVLTCMNLVTPILSLQMERSIFRFLIEVRKDESLQQKIISTSIIAVLPSILLTVVVLPVLGILFNIQYWQYILAIIISSIIANIVLQIPRGLGKNIHYSIGSAIVGISNALISIVSVVILGMGVKGILLANIISHLLGIGYVFGSMHLRSKIHLSQRNRKTLKQLLKFSIPMIPNDICHWVINASDRFLIFLFLGNEMNGIYAAATKFPALMVTAYNVFNMSWMETVSVHIEDEDASDYLSSVLNQIIRLSGSACLVANAIISLVFGFVIGESFIDSYHYIAVLIFGSFFNMIVGALSALYFGYKKTSEIAKTNALAAIINIAINIVCIRFMGIWAAVISTVIAYIVVAVYRIFNIQKAIKLKPKIADFVIISLVFAINIYIYHSPNIWLKLLNLILSIAFVAIFNRSFLAVLLKKCSKLITGKQKNEK